MTNHKPQPYRRYHDSDSNHGTAKAVAAGILIVLMVVAALVACVNGFSVEVPK